MNETQEKFTYEDVENALMKPKSWWAIVAILPFVRRISRYIANRTKITPNQITLFSFGLGVLSAVFFFLHTKLFFILGAVFFELSYLFDCVDGTVARLKRIGNIYGDVLDHVLDRWRMFINLIALTFGYYHLTRETTIIILAFIYTFLNMVNFYYTYTFNRVSAGWAKRTGKSVINTKVKSPKPGFLNKYIDFMVERHYAVFPGDIESDALVFFFGPILAVFNIYSIKVFLILGSILIGLTGGLRLWRFMLKIAHTMKRKHKRLSISRKRDVKIYGVVLAGGIGERVGEGMPKQFLTIAGKPVFIHTLEKFENHPLIKKIILVMPREWTEKAKEEIEKYGIKKVHDIIPGGRTRQESSYKAIEYLEPMLRDEDIVVIHDAVRPFVTEEIITRSIEGALDFGGADVVIPATDTIVQDGTRFKGFIHRIPDRRTLRYGQTPQTFRYGIIKYAHRKAREEDFQATDDAGLLIRYGLDVKLVEGSPENMKITTKTDLVLAQCLYRHLREKK